MTTSGASRAGRTFEADGESYLQVIPVDPHRLFAHWYMSPGLRRHARRTVPQPYVHERLILRLFRLPHPHENLSKALSEENFPLDARLSRTHLTLAVPGGFAAAVLGVQDRGGRFFPLLTSSRVALPAAPAPAGPASLPRLHSDLEETAILARTANADLPPELQKLPDAGRPKYGEPNDIPATHALDERGIVGSALAARNETESGDAPATPSADSPAPAYRDSPPPSSHDSGGHFSEGAAPIAVTATLLAEAYIRTGERLVIEGATLGPVIGGTAVWTRSWTDFPTAWTLLHETGHPPSPAHAPLRFTVEIEGVVRDPEYLPRLPRHVSVDTSGRFRTIRPLPDDHPILPEWRVEPPDSSAA